MLSALCLVGTVLASSYVAGSAALAVYALSFWHYLFYWLAYRHGAVQPARFPRDAILMKAVALAGLAGVYLSGPWHWISATVVVCGFSLNAAAARALGTARTYYGWELGDLPHRRVTAFPYSLVPHPMLLGNMVAFAGTLLNPVFRRNWWALAAIHVLLNAALLVMETAVPPKRRARRTGAVAAWARRGEPLVTSGRVVQALGMAGIGAVSGLAVATASGWPAGLGPCAAVLSACGVYAYVRFGWYVSASHPDRHRVYAHSREAA